MKKRFLFLLLCIIFTAENMLAQENIGELVDGIRYLVWHRGTDSAYVEVIAIEEGNPVKLEFPDKVKISKKKLPVKKISSLGAGGANLQEVKLPNTLERLSGFRECRNLTTIEVPKSVVTIGPWAFEGCISLRHVVMQEGLREIGLYAFKGCNNLQSITLPSTLQQLGSGAFRACSALRSAVIPSLLKILELSVFEGCTSLIQVQLGNYTKKISPDAFKNCSSLSQITIPELVETIGSGAFQGCTSLRQVDFAPESGVKSIESFAFADCASLTGFTPSRIGYFLEQLGDYAFKGCKSLNKIGYMRLDSIPKSAFWGCESLQEVSISDASYIGENAFDDCKSLKKVYLSKDKIKFIGDGAFSGCKSLESVYGLHSDIVFDSYSSTFPYSVDIGNLELSYRRYSKEALTKAIAEWQKKKKYESTAQWRERVTPETRMNKYEELKDSVRAKYIARYSPDSLICDIRSYDADAGVFKLEIENLNVYRYGGGKKRIVGGPHYIYAKVPANEAEAFEKSWDEVKLQPTYCITKDYLDIASCTFTLNGKKYESPVLYDDESADFNIELPPLDLDLLNSSNLDMAAVKDKTIDKDIPATGINSPNTFVVIIGNENYKQVARVPYALNDAKVFKEYCQKTLGVPDDNIRSYPDATYGIMLSSLKDIQSISKAYNGDINVIFYYAGHGVPDEKTHNAYLLPVDVDGSNTNLCLSTANLYKELNSLRARKILVFMDACFSGAQRGDGMLTSARGVALKVKDTTPKGNMVVLTAATNDETAYPYKEKGHGMFTYYLLKKMRDTKGEATLGELSDYITEQVVRQSVVVNHKSQTPTLIPSSAIGENWKTWKLK